VVPRRPAGPHRRLPRPPPGGRLRWSLRAFTGEAVGVGCRCGDGLTAGYLGGGEYGVVAGYGAEADASGALVELAGEPVTLAPTDDAGIEREGDVATVSTDRHGDGERPADATLVMTRADRADERVIAEQVMGPDPGFRPLPGRGLRNALAALEPGVERVVVRTDERVADRATGDGDVRRVRFRGGAYEIRQGERSDGG
jgi:hypothetical protein